jgi:hypothetical protein
MHWEMFLEEEFLGSRNEIRIVNRNYIVVFFISVFILRFSFLFSTTARPAVGPIHPLYNGH